MNKKYFGLFVASLLVLVVISACGNKADGGNTNAANEGTAAEQPSGNTGASNTPENSPPSDPAEQSEAPDSSASADPSNEELLIIIDQTQKPIEGNSFDFVVNKRPEGYMLSKMEWISDKNHITNTLQEAMEHGGSGGDGFYISGDGQFMGFFYPDELKGEKGDVKITFANDQGKEISWKKTITLK